jgi:hypothetical protein
VFTLLLFAFYVRSRHVYLLGRCHPLPPQADSNNHLLRRVNLTTGLVTTLAGRISGSIGSNNFGNADGIGTAASFNLPWGVAIDSAGTVLVVVRLGSKML